MENNIDDFAVGDVVQHVFWGVYATVEKVARQTLYVRTNLTNQKLVWRPCSARKVG